MQDIFSMKQAVTRSISPRKPHGRTRPRRRDAA